MRIHFSEKDKYEGRPLSEQLLSLLRERQFAGATMFRGAMSFGANSTLHTDRIEVMSLDLPLVMECVETEDHIRQILPDLDRMIGGGLITLERAHVVLYRSGSARDDSHDEA